MHAQAAAPLRRALTAFTQTALLGDCVVARPALPERSHHTAETRQPPPGRTGGPSADRSGKTPAPPPPPSAAASSLGPAAAAAAAACARASAVAAAGSARRRCRTSSSARAPARRGAEVLQTRAESAADSGQKCCRLGPAHGMHRCCVCSGPGPGPGASAHAMAACRATASDDLAGAPGSLCARAQCRGLPPAASGRSPVRVPQPSGVGARAGARPCA